MPDRSSSTPSGVLVVDKPMGRSSAAVVSAVKRVMQVRRAGHAGTLDPMATGVLVVCVGEATKLAAYLLGDDKEYLAVARLGEETDTWDADGKVQRREPVPPWKADAIVEQMRALEGRIEQRAPAFSAIKRDGRPLYERARRGEAVDAPVRTVAIHRLELVEWKSPDLTFRVCCSKGTYVRSLAVDLASRLGTLAHLVALRRERSGDFDLRGAVSWEAVAGGRRTQLEGALVAPAEALGGLPRAFVEESDAAALAVGRPIYLPGTKAENRIGLVLRGGPLVAIGEVREGRIWPVRVLSRH